MHGKLDDFVPIAIALGLTAFCVAETFRLAAVSFARIARLSRHFMHSRRANKKRGVFYFCSYLQSTVANLNLAMF